ncbi:MAG: hypothetical protein PHE86_03575 [Candidatus Marinimicrobia bacterium]|nr:hypothetical protein [Candidatus Neomarinimicrobiota bacterium]MDD5581916.1 hypothetical protein [Candidatus Neomarinimicrobiota bacterium]
MLNKLTIELDDDQLQEFKELITKLEKTSPGETISVKITGVLKGALKDINKQLLHFEDFKKRDLW